MIVVDDNLALAENIAEILTFEGYTTEVFGSAEEALSNALNKDVGILVTDYRLPGMSGPELVKRFRQRCDQLWGAVVISAYSDERTMSAAREVGARFLSKPLDLALLGTFIRGLGEPGES